MKRIVGLLMAVGISTLVFAAAAPTPTPPPPGPGSDWTQDSATNVPPMQNGGMSFGGPMRTPQSMPGIVDFQQRMQDMQRQMQQMQAQAQASRDAGIRQSLGVNDAQWTQIKPRLDRIDRLKAEVNASLDPGGSLNNGPGFTSVTTPNGGWAGGGFGFSTQMGPNGTRSQSWSSAPSGGSAEPTKTGSLCQELNSLLQMGNVPAGQVSQKIADLRLAKERAQRELARERKELRSLLNFRQEAALIVMGYLD
jgi:hypothetical protein